MWCANACHSRSTAPTAVYPSRRELAALEWWDDETPYELVSVGDALIADIAAHASEDTETMDVLMKLVKFTHQQCLFRAILDGQLVLTEMDFRI